MLLRSRLSLPGCGTRVWRSRGGLWFPLFDVVIAHRANVLALLRRPGQPGLLIPACNIITNAGDVHMAQRGAGETPTNAFGIFEMASAGTPAKAADRSSFTVISGSQKAHESGYPKTNDSDPDNTGAGTDVVTRTAIYSAASFSHNAITHGMITNSSPGASEPIFAGWAWAASINKTSSDTLKVIHNADVTGV